jgi:hypothetical protein
VDRQQEAVNWLHEQLEWERLLAELRRMQSVDTARRAESDERAAA